MNSSCASWSTYRLMRSNFQGFCRSSKKPAGSTSINSVIQNLMCKYLMYLIVFFSDNTYFKKFAQRIFKHWSFLKPHLSHFNALWEEYRGYKNQIPSYGALIFNKTLDKLLFIIYHNPRDRIVRKLDFPKGKVN